MASYWYSTDGMDQKRLSGCHLDVLDRAYESRTRIKIFDDHAFGPDVPAVADPFLGTMTAGEIHYGLYRNPSLRVSEDELDNLVFPDSGAAMLQFPTLSSSSSSSSPSSTENRVLVVSHNFLGQRRHSSPATKTSSRRSLAKQHCAAGQPGSQVDDCVCCVIS